MTAELRTPVNEIQQVLSADLIVCQENISPSQELLTKSPWTAGLTEMAVFTGFHSVENLGCGGNDLLWGFYAVD